MEAPEFKVLWRGSQECKDLIIEKGTPTEEREALKDATAQKRFDAILARAVDTERLRAGPARPPTPNTKSAGWKSKQTKNSPHTHRLTLRFANKSALIAGLAGGSLPANK